MPGQNRLEIILSAKRDGLTRGLRAAEQDAKKAASSISKALESSGDGAAVLVKAIEGVDDAFAKSADEGEKALDNLADASSKAGKELREAFIKSGKSIDEAEQDVKALVGDIRKLSQARSDVQGLKKEFDDLGKEIGDSQKLLDGLNLQNALQGVEHFADKISEVGKVFKDTAGESRKLERDIKLTFSNPKEAEKYAKAVKDLQNQYGDLIEDTDGLGLAIKRLDTLNAASTKNLERITKLALDSGKGFDDAADDVGEFLASIDSGNADFEILGETLRSNFGIAGEALREYGAEVDLNGKLIADTREQQEKAQRALKRYIDESERFADISTRNKDAQAKLGDEFGKFRREVGENIDAFQELAAEALLPVLEGLNNLSPGFKKAVAGAALLAPAVAGTAVAGLNAVAVYSALTGKTVTMAAAKTAASRAAIGLSGALRTAGSSAASLLTVAGGFPAVFAAAGIALFSIKKASDGYVEALEQADKAHASLLQTQAEAIRQDKEILKIRRLSVEEIRKQTDAIVDLYDKRIFATSALKEALDALTEAEQNGGDVEAAKKRVEEARKLRNEIDKSNAQAVARQKELAKAEKQRFKEAQDAYKQFKSDYDNGVFDSEKKALASLETLAVGLSGPAAKTAEKDARDLRGKILDVELDGLKKKIAAEKVSAEESKAILDNLLRRYQANADARAKAEESVDEANKAVLDRREERLKALLQRELNLEKAAIAQKRALLDGSGEFGSLEKRLEKGEDVIAQAKREVQEREKNLAKLLDEEAALERIAIQRQEAADIKADPANTERIQKLAAEQQRQLNATVEDEKRKLSEQTIQQVSALEDKAAKGREKKLKDALSLEKQRLDLVKQTAEEEIAGTESAFALRRELLEQQGALGQDVSAQLRDLAKEESEAAQGAAKKRLELAKEEIKLRQEAADVGATPEQQKLNAQQALLDLQKAQRVEREAQQAVVDQDTQKLKDQTAELVKQLDLLKKQKNERTTGFDTSFGSLSSVADINNTPAGFGVKRSERDTETQIKDVEKKIERNLGIINSRENAAKGGGPFAAFQSSQRTQASAGSGLPPQEGAPTEGLAGGTTEVISLLQQIATSLQGGGDAQQTAPVDPSGFGFSSARGIPGLR